MLISVVLPLSLAFIMFSLGIGLTVADFLRVGQRPLAFAIGALNQVVLLPVVTYFIVLAFGISGELAVGFMVLAACPGGVTSNILSRLAKGDVALSVSLTAVISLTSIITVPLILGFALNNFLGATAPQIDITSTAFTMFLLTVVPVILGLVCRLVMPDMMLRIQSIVSKIATGLFIIIIIAALATNWGEFLENLPTLGPALITLLIVLTGVGFASRAFLGRNMHEAKTISVETGIQNSALGIVIAALMVGGAEGFTSYSQPAAVYGILMYVVMLPAIFFYRRMD